MNLQSIRKISGGVALLCASFVFASQVLAVVPPARVIVAKSGGNYTTITAALNAITPTANNPYVIEVWPGVYTEPATINLKSYVHIKGSGRDVTTVKVSGVLFTIGGSNFSSRVFVIADKTDVTISGLTITGAEYGIHATGTNSTTSITISDSTFSKNREGMTLFSGVIARVTGNNITDNQLDGIGLKRGSANITDNLISRNGNGTDCLSASGIYLDDVSPTAVIKGNVITGNNGCGIALYDRSYPFVSDNIITDNSEAGIEFDFASSGGTYTNNKIVNNGGTLSPDIKADVAGTGMPNFSFNIFDDIAGTRGVGSYNVNSNGDPILVP